MYTFETPEPISATIKIVSGSAHIIVGDRVDTTVRIRPGDESKKPDVLAAEQTQVSYSNGKLVIKVPEPRGLSSWTGRGNSVVMDIELPAGSQIHGVANSAEFVIEGTAGDCRFENSSGDIRLDRTANLYVETSSGDVDVTHAAGHVEINTASGGVRIAEVDGTAVIKNATGDLWVGEVTGDLLLHSATGSISVDRAHTSVEARTAHGGVRVGEVIQGDAELTTASGQIDIGIRKGTAAWLDANSRTGRVHSSLDNQDGPENFDNTARIRARTWFGDIRVHRSA
jgi:DUF4097 and DUF4098 domain-containing protein YvlB